MKAKEAVGDLFLALDHKVEEAAASIGQLCEPTDCERLAGKLGNVPFDVMTGGLDQVLLRGTKDVDDDTKIKIVGRVRELGTAEANQFLKDVQIKWPAKSSPRVKQAIDQAVIATSGSPGSSAPGGRRDRQRALACHRARGRASSWPAAPSSPAAVDRRGSTCSPPTGPTTAEPRSTAFGSASARRRSPPAADVVVGVAANDHKMIGVSLATGAKWTFEHALDARPIVTGSVVVASGGGEVFALDAATGRLVWRRPTGGLALLGAGDDGNVTVAAFREAGDTGSVLLAVTHDGQIVRQIETEKALGAPAVVAGLAFVPWAGQYVSVIDLANGDETARVTLRQETSRAWTEGGTLWFGGIGYVRFDERIHDASRGRAATVSVPPRELPGMPKLIPTGTSPLPAAANAEDKTREYAKPIATDSGAALQDGHWYGTYFRLAMGFESEHSKLAWVHLHDADFIGGAAAARRPLAVRRPRAASRSSTPAAAPCSARWGSASRCTRASSTSTPSERAERCPR